MTTLRNKKAAPPVVAPSSSNATTTTSSGTSSSTSQPKSKLLAPFEVPKAVALLKWYLKRADFVVYTDTYALPIRLEDQGLLFFCQAYRDMFAGREFAFNKREYLEPRPVLPPHPEKVNPDIPAIFKSDYMSAETFVMLREICQRLYLYHRLDDPAVDHDEFLKTKLPQVTSHYERISNSPKLDPMELEIINTVCTGGVSLVELMPNIDQLLLACDMVNCEYLLVILIKTMAYIAIGSSNSRQFLESFELLPPSHNNGGKKATTTTTVPTPPQIARDQFSPEEIRELELRNAFLFENASNWTIPVDILNTFPVGQVPRAPFGVGAVINAMTTTTTTTRQEGSGGGFQTPLGAAAAPLDQNNQPISTPVRIAPRRLNFDEAEEEEGDGDSLGSSDRDDDEDEQEDAALENQQQQQQQQTALDVDDFVVNDDNEERNHSDDDVSFEDISDDEDDTSEYASDGDDDDRT